MTVELAANTNSCICCGWASWLCQHHSHSQTLGAVVLELGLPKIVVGELRYSHSAPPPSASPGNFSQAQGPSSTCCKYLTSTAGRRAPPPSLDISTVINSTSGTHRRFPWQPTAPDPWSAMMYGTDESHGRGARQQHPGTHGNDLWHYLSHNLLWSYWGKGPSCKIPDRDHDLSRSDHCSTEMHVLSSSTLSASSKRKERLVGL